jgi:menaquinone-dependent protoporphyrinogen oxidase
MRVLVAASSKHGATAEIAAEIGRVLSDRGVDTLVMRLEDVFDVSGFDAVVLGSAIYAGRWTGEARRFVNEHGAELAQRPTWLFSSGPIGEPLKPDEESAVKIADAVEKTAAREHRLFAGRIDRSVLGFGERTVVRMVGAKDGDYRDWEDVRAWAASIAAALL